MIEVTSPDLSLIDEMVDQAARKVDHLLARRRDPRLPRRERIADDRVGVGDVKVVADDNDAERGIEMVEQDRLQLRLPVTVSVTK